MSTKTAPTPKPTRDPADVDRARQALRDHLQALDYAEATAKAARVATGKLDVGNLMLTEPNLVDARRAAKARLDRLPDPESYAQVTHRRVRAGNGLVVRVTVKMAREMLRDGNLIEWLDGLPPEAPASESSGLPSGAALEAGGLRTPVAGNGGNVGVTRGAPPAL